MQTRYFYAADLGGYAAVPVQPLLDGEDRENVDRVLELIGSETLFHHYTRYPTDSFPGDRPPDDVVFAHSMTDCPACELRRLLVQHFPREVAPSAPREVAPSAPPSRKERTTSVWRDVVLPLAGILWIIGCVSAFFYFLVLAEYGLAVGFIFAGLVPVVLDA